MINFEFCKIDFLDPLDKYGLNELSEAAGDLFKVSMTRARFENS